MYKTTATALMALLLTLIPGFVLAQRTISGRVTDAETGNPLIGATVIALGTTAGAATDESGNFSFRAPETATQLRATYIGYLPQVVEIGSESSFAITMQPEVITTGEVVLIGYGTVKREDATGSIQSVSVESFNQGAINSAQELVAGKVAGVQITTGAAPGDGAAIRIRGGSSLSAANDPLIVIDGVPVFNDGIAGSRNPLAILNPNDIETFTVLKDASATAIYGSRASNGVILITTKKGAVGTGKVRVGYAGNVSISTRLNEIDVLDGDGYRALISDRFAEGHPARALLGTANTDWQAEIFRPALGHDHNLNLAGAVGKFPYRVSLGYTFRDGILRNDNFQRTTGALNLTPKFLNGQLQVNASLKGMLTQNTFANQGAIGAAVAFDPTQPVFAPGNGYDDYFTWVQGNGDPNPLAPANPLALLNMRDDVSNVQRIIANVGVDYRLPFLPDLRANLNLGYDASNGQGTINVPANAPFAFAQGGEIREYFQQQRNELLEFYLNYTKKLGNHNIDVMGGYSWQRFYRNDSSWATNVAGDIELTPPNAFPKEYYLVSLFGRVNYTWDRLLLTFTLRQDGTSRFSPENRFGLFPAAAAAFKIVEQQGGNVSNLKVRLGYGVTGQQDIGGDFYPYLARYLASQSTAQYQFGETFIPTLRPNGYDANIKWEETTTYNIALDYGFFNDRINGSIEYYRRTTTDLLNFIPVAAGTNLTNFITTNVGDLQNNGVEFSINTVPVMKDNMKWEFGFNVTANRNEITRLTATEDPTYQGVFTGGISGGVGNTIQIHSVGFPANSFYVYEQVYDQAGVPIEGLYVDRDGDGQITPDDRYRLENPVPDAFFGFTSRFEYGNFDFLFAGRANVGNYVYNNLLSDGAFYNRLYNSTGYLSNVNAATQGIDFTVPQYFSDHFIHNASFLRFDHVTVGYNLPKIFGDGSMRIYGVVQNPILITRYEGLDPEVFGGIDGNIYPRSRTFVLGVNANF